MVKLPFTVAEVLRKQLESLNNSVATSEQSGNGDAGSTVSVGTTCKNGGCRVTFQGPATDEEVCLHHPGVPVFHEGMKYWSCCLRKTSDFTAFLEQAGCAKGKHTWIKQVSKEAQLTSSVRHDWHQTATHVVVSIFAKSAYPQFSVVEANAVKLHARIVFGAEKNVCDLEFILAGIIDVDQSKVEYLGSKVEIKMRKGEPASWRTLALPVEEVTSGSVTKGVANVQLNESTESEYEDTLDDIDKLTP